MVVDDELIGPEDLAGHLHIPVASVYAMNHRGTGPRRIKVGKHVRYRKSDVREWLESRTVEPVLR